MAQRIIDTDTLEQELDRVLAFGLVSLLLRDHLAGEELILQLVFGLDLLFCYFYA